MAWPGHSFDAIKFELGPKTYFKIPKKKIIKILDRQEREFTKPDVPQRARMLGVQNHHRIFGKSHRREPRLAGLPAANRFV